MAMLNNQIVTFLKLGNPYSCHISTYSWNCTYKSIMFPLFLLVLKKLRYLLVLKHGNGQIHHLQMTFPLRTSMCWGFSMFGFLEGISPIWDESKYVCSFSYRSAPAKSVLGLPPTSTCTIPTPTNMVKHLFKSTNMWAKRYNHIQWGTMCINVYPLVNVYITMERSTHF